MSGGTLGRTKRGSFRILIGTFTTDVDPEDHRLLESPSKGPGKDAARGASPQAIVNLSAALPLAAHAGVVAASAVRRNDWMRPVGYGLLNVGSATSLILLNKTVFSVYNFHFTYALTAVRPYTCARNIPLSSSQYKQAFLSFFKRQTP